MAQFKFRLGKRMLNVEKRKKRKKKTWGLQRISRQLRLACPVGALRHKEGRKLKSKVQSPSQKQVHHQTWRHEEVVFRSEENPYKRDVERSAHSSPSRLPVDVMRPPFRKARLRFSRKSSPKTLTRRYEEQRFMISLLTNAVLLPSTHRKRIFPSPMNSLTLRKQHLKPQSLKVERESERVL